MKVHQCRRLHGWAYVHCKYWQSQGSHPHDLCCCSCVLVWRCLLCSRLWHAPKMIHLSHRCIQHFSVGWWCICFELMLLQLTVGGLDISSIPPLSLLILHLSKEICGSLPLRGTCRYCLMCLVLLKVFARNVLSEGVCQAEDNTYSDVSIGAKMRRSWM